MYCLHVYNLLAFLTLFELKRPKYPKNSFKLIFTSHYESLDYSNGFNCK